MGGPTWTLLQRAVLTGCCVALCLVASIAYGIPESIRASQKDEAIAHLRELQERIDALQKQLEALQREMAEVRLYIQQQDQEVIPKIQHKLAEVMRFRPNNYVQFQWFDSQENRADEGFALRRFRIGQTNVIDSRTQMRLSFDVAAGAQRISAELRDAQLIWDIEPTGERVGVQLLAGQQLMPLGYDLARSSAEREMPERALYNRTMFAGDRGRGIFLRYGLGNHALIHFGLWNSLTIQDPQQTSANTFGNLGSTLAYHLGWRYYTLSYEFGLSGFFGQRAGFSYTDPSNNQPVQVPATNRRFVYVDATVLDFLARGLTLRGELMLGRDRVPTTRTVGGVTIPRYLRATDILGYQVQLTYQYNYRNALTVRYDLFDPDTDRRGDSTRTWGFAYTYFINPNVRLTAAYEIPDEEGAEVRNNQFTVRLQYRY